MCSADDVRSRYTTRSFLGTTISIASAASASLLLPGRIATGNKPPQSELHTYNGGTDPYPIRLLDLSV